MSSEIEILRPLLEELSDEQKKIFGEWLFITAFHGRNWVAAASMFPKLLPGLLESSRLDDEIQREHFIEHNKKALMKLSELFASFDNMSSEIRRMLP